MIFILFHCSLITITKKMFKGKYTGNEPAPKKIYRKACVTRKDTNQTLRIFLVCMCFLQPPNYPNRDKKEPLLYWMDVQADLTSTVAHFVEGSLCNQEIADLILGPSHNKDFRNDTSCSFAWCSALRK